MSKKEKEVKKMSFGKEVFRYIVFGIGTCAVNLLAFYLLKSVGYTQTDLGMTLTNLFCWFLAVVFAYTTNRIWVFQSKNKTKNAMLKEFITFILGRVATGVLEVLLPTPVSHMFENGIGLSFAKYDILIDGQWVAKLLVSVLIIILNYIISKLFVFKKSK